MKDQKYIKLFYKRVLLLCLIELEIFHIENTALTYNINLLKIAVLLRKLAHMCLQTVTYRAVMSIQENMRRVKFEFLSASIFGPQLFLELLNMSVPIK